MCPQPKEGQNQKSYHISVLPKEVIEYLKPEPNENFIDCTVGAGGHSKAILKENGPQGKVLGIELDSELFYKKLLKEDIERLILVNDSFLNLEKIVKERKFENISGILFDLGLSSWHLKESGRGFTFQKDEPLDMRYNTTLLPSLPDLDRHLTAEQILNHWSVSKIEQILKEYGEERFAKSIAREIVKERKKVVIKTTFQLVEIIKRILPSWCLRGRIHFATKTFQALRIAVNKELFGLQETLPQALKVLKREGRIVVISFHSLEDRIVKNFFKKESKNNSLKILTKKPVRPGQEEINFNPSSRSAKLRAAEKL